MNTFANFLNIYMLCYFVYVELSYKISVTYVVRTYVCTYTFVLTHSYVRARTQPSNIIKQITKQNIIQFEDVLVAMKCLHVEPCAHTTTENGSFWFCNQTLSCNFFCSFAPENEGLGAT